MSKYCEQCGTKLENDAEFCTECGAQCNNTYAEKRKVNEIKTGKEVATKSKKKYVLIGVAVLGICIVGKTTGLFSNIKSIYEHSKDAKSEKQILTEDGNAYKMTVQEYCDRFNTIADESGVAVMKKVLREQLEEQKRSSLEEAAEYDSGVAELVTQTMTPMMIPDTTLLECEDTEETSNGPDYIRYAYTNQYCFIPDNIGIQVLAKRETGEVVGIAANFPMNYRNIGDKLAKLVCDSWGADSEAGDFQDLYNKMKETGGYGYTYHNGTVFELMYYGDNEESALFKMSACTKEHYEEEWLNNPDLPSKDNPIKKENVEDNSENSEMVEDSISYAELVQNLQSYQGKWSDFGQQNDAYQGMIKDLVESTTDLSDYFSGNADELDTIITAFHGGLDNTDEAECAVQLFGTGKESGEYTELWGVVSLDESGNVQFVINYVGAAR